MGPECVGFRPTITRRNQSFATYVLSRSSLNITFPITITLTLTKSVNSYALVDRQKYYDMNGAIIYLKFSPEFRESGLTKAEIRQKLRNEYYKGPLYNRWVTLGKRIPGGLAWIKYDENGGIQLAVEGSRHHPLLNFISYLQSSLGPNVIHRLYWR